MLSTKQFAEYAKKNFVLVEADFPVKKRQSEALKKANQELKDQYGVEGFPTLVILDSEGKKLGEQIYDGDGTKALIKELNKYRKK